MHLKRQAAPKNWPIKRKGTKYIVKPGFDAENSVPLLIVLRDILKVVQNRKESKKAIHMKYIFINNKPAVDEKTSMTLFDTLSLVPSKKYFRLGLSAKGKFEIKEINEKEANYKISKVVNKKIIKGKKTQLNLNDGRNFLSEIKCKVNDSVLINLKEKKIERCISLKEKSPVIIFSGKHAGKTGVIKKIDEVSRTAEIDSQGESINVLIKQIVVTE